MDVVIVGAGLAAAKTAEALRRDGFDSAITVIGAESRRPYERPGLSKEYLQGSDSLESLFVHNDDWAREHDVALQTSRVATSIDPTQRTVTVDSGTAIEYGALVLATGAQARRLDIPGAEYAMVLRDVDDSTALRAAFYPAGRLAIIGGGWIGLEVAAAASQAGMEVTVFEAGNTPLEAAMGTQLGQFFADLHRCAGVDVQTGTVIEEIIHDGEQATGVRVDGRNVDADVVLMSVGAAPSTSLAVDAGLTVDNGIVVDERLRTSDSHVLAAGDVANAHNLTRQEHLRVEHWDNALRQGELAAQSILGMDAVYDWQPYFFTDQYDLGMEYVGLRSPGDHAVVRGTMDSAAGGGEFIVFWQDEDRVAAAMNVNIWDVNDDLRALIGKNVDPQRLADSRVALAELP